MTARTATLTIALIALTAATAAAQAAKPGESATESPAAQPAAKPVVAGFEIPPFPPNPRIDKAKQRAEQARREYEAAIAQSESETAAADAEQPSRGPSRAPSRRSSARANYELFGGYAALRDFTDDLSFPLGWVASVAKPLDHQLSIVGSASGGYKSIDIGGVTVAHANVHTFTAGPQISRRFDDGISAYGHLQAGIAVMHGSAFGFGASSTGFALIPGAGVDFSLTRDLAVRLGGDITIVKDQDSWNGFRFVTGIVLTR